MKTLRILVLAGSVMGFTGLMSSFSYMSLSMQGMFPMPVARVHRDEPKQICIVEDPQISEASGLAVSRQHQDAVWMHNDSGDDARLFLVGLDGATRAVVSLNVDRPMDWEDMCSFEVDGEKWLLIADTGDNGRVRSRSARPCELLLVREPLLETGIEKRRSQPATSRLDVAAHIEFDFPNGPEDCESVAVDTHRREILLLTKTDPLRCQLFKLPLSLTSGRCQLTAEPVAKVAIPFATSMDVSADGQRLAIVNMFSGAVLNRHDSEDWSDACRNPITVLTLPAQPQCETVCFDFSSQSLFVNSERAGQPVWRLSVPAIEVVE